MNWITNFVRPKVKSLWSGSKPDTPDNLWRKCPSCNGMIFHRDLEAAQYVCMHCDHHLKINASQRMKYLFDDAAWDAIALPDVPIDPLKFKDEKRYADRLREARTKTGQQDALQAARGSVAGVRTTVAVQSFDFMGGSLGMAVGEGLVASMRAALDHRTPYVLFTASGGARMQEGILSLMQMPRVTIAIQMLREAVLPYVVVHTDPTTGGVTASYAMLGDVHVSEPGALIGFAGPRVIENTIREKLPEGFQRAETCSTTAWSTWSSTATRCARIWAACSNCSRARPRARRRRAQATNPAPMGCRCSKRRNLSTGPAQANPRHERLAA
jgi:acetyl-CoA carboxylase carboxyl transferase subunit beta